MTGLRPAALAFDAVASVFDHRYGEWQSVAAQRRAVRAALMQTFPAGSHLLELGGGTGEDAAFLAARGYNIHLTDASPAMVASARNKLLQWGCRAEAVPAEEMESFAARRLANGHLPFDGIFSNFAALNCVDDLTPTARGLSQLITPGGRAVLVVFGTACPGEILVETLHGRPGQALRRFRRGPAPARLGGRQFTVSYHSQASIIAAMTPHFRLRRRLGIGIFVPPSAAEPLISRYPRIVKMLEAMDRITAASLAMLGDHVLYEFQRLP
ncbi:MAG TPA: class I SAM-dependent methyltransferase [Rhizomicrobium sp.]|jgi:SAM-dependent methyltransferase